MSYWNIPRRPAQPDFGTVVIEDDDALNPASESASGSPPDEDRPDIRDLLLDETD